MRTGLMGVVVLATAGCVGVGGCSAKWKMVVENQSSQRVAAIYMPRSTGSLIGYPTGPGAHNAGVLEPGERVEFSHRNKRRGQGYFFGVLFVATCEEPGVMYGLSGTTRTVIADGPDGLVLTGGTAARPVTGELETSRYEQYELIRVDLAAVCRGVGTAAEAERK